MKFVIEINCDNAAFDRGDGDRTEAGEEVSAILADVAELMANGHVDFPQLFDSNRNNVGFAKFVADEP